MMATTKSGESSSPSTGCSKEAVAGNARYSHGSQLSAFASARPITACLL